MKKILILTIDAGFGHRRAAEAIEEAFHVSYPDECEVEIVNPMDNPNTPDIVRTLETGYDEMVTDDPRLYQIAYSATDAPMVAGLIQRAMIAVLSDAMEHLVEEHQPDAMILTHPVYIEAAVKACQKADLTTPVNTVVTDLIGVHSLWFHKKADLTFVPTGQVMKQAISQGLATSQVQLSGLPVQPAIALEERSKAEIRESLGWEQEITTALIVGSARARRTAAIAHLLDRSGLPLQIAAVAGGDKRSEEELRSTTWKGIVHPYGFVTNMVEMMHAADFIVCKAGG